MEQMFGTAVVEQGPLATLSASIDVLMQEDLNPLGDEEQAEGLQTLCRNRDRLDAEFARRLRHFDRSNAYESSGALSAASWLRWKCRLTGAMASWRVRTARLLEQLPGTADAFKDGEIGFQHVSVLASCAKQLGSEVVAEAEPILLEAARKVDARDLGRVTRHLRFCLDAEGGRTESANQIEESWLHLSETLGGVFYLNGKLDPEGGTLLKTALEGLIGKPGRDDDRAHSQKRAEALVELARRQLNSGTLPESGGQRPHLTVTTSITSLRAEQGAEPGSLLSGEPLSPHTVRRLACDCVLTPIVVGPDGEPVAMGRGRRTIRGRKHRALVLRDCGCRFPGCDRPPEWTDGHHLKHWIDGGGDELSNLLLLCRRHHVKVHEGGFKLVLQPDGEVTLLTRWDIPETEPP